ncbi:hypothetical protein [Streptomyces jumonjinensis]|uniref:Uncharacterized protein n=1 Tax=Streptomyces jumonjinensis TaxID=1945 RepID=A0A646KGC0_STRJU|nr:hypothetical protein [Streptomyces jumonjinensis]MQT01264.1 hypothetical protein [Streptomyces jumonjinensis]
MNPTETEKNTDATNRKDAEDTARPTEAVAVAEPEATGAAAADRTAGPDASADAPAAPADEDGAEGIEDADDGGIPEEKPRESSGLLSAAAGVVATALGVVGLSGSWVGQVAAERQTLLGQLESSQGGSVAEQISAVYGDAWHTTALVNGIFALLALIVGVTVLTRPGRPGWVRACAVAGAVLGGIGILASVSMYFDLILALPQGGS